RYDAAAFRGLPRDRFLEALRAEGVPASGGYRPLPADPNVTATLASRGYMRVYGAEALATLRERNVCPENDRLCDEAVWFTQTMLLGPRQDMDDIGAAVSRTKASADRLVGQVSQR